MKGELASELVRNCYQTNGADQDSLFIFERPRIVSVMLG
jgi:hypothetical protein